MDSAALYDRERTQRSCAAYGTDIEAAARNGKRALHLAVEMGQVKTVDILLAAGANMDEGANNGCTPLMFAVLNNRGLAIGELLLNPRR